MKLSYLICIVTFFSASALFAEKVDLGPRPYYLIDKMIQSPLKTKLQSCIGQEEKPNLFSIGHRGAPLMFPEHTAESYRAAARMGAGIVECDVTFTADKELVCRHAQNDLHLTTNILAQELAVSCTSPFRAASANKDASAECRSSDITLAQFRSLTGKMDGANSKAKTVSQYMDGTPNWRTDIYATTGQLMTHAESISLLKELGVKFTPELKSATVEMPFNGFSQQDFAQKMIDEYKAADVPASDVWAQSSNLQDIFYWLEHEPEFGAQAVFLDGSFGTANWSNMNPATWRYNMGALKSRGLNYIAPPMWVLLTLEDGKMVPSAYAKEAKSAGLKIITWTLERSGSLKTGGGWYFQTVTETIDNDADYFEVLDVLAQDIGIVGIFSDWPATVTYYANCMGLE